MSGVFGSLFRGNSKLPARAAGVNINTSVYGKPIPLVYGKTRVSSNLLLYGNFQAQLTGSAGSGGGKGGLFSPQQSQQQQYQYFAALAFALCEGPINSVGVVYQDKNLTSLAALGFSLFTGTFPQSPWGQQVSWTYQTASGSTVSGSASTALGYNGVAYVAASNYFLGNSAAMPNVQFEILAIGSTNSAGSTANDADPNFVLTDVLTNVNHGLGFVTSTAGATVGPRLADLSTWQNYCYAQGFFISPAYDTQRTAADIIDELGVATNTAPVWTQGQLFMIPYGDLTITANGKTYTAPLVQYALTDNDFMKSPSGGGNVSGGAAAPVVLERKRGSDKTNSIKVEFLDRANNYAPSIAYANDQALIDNYGLRSNGSKQLHLFCASSCANVSAQLQLRRAANITNTYYFDLDQRYILLDPMDVVTITDPNLGLNAQAVRILEIQENDDGTLSFKAEEFLGTVSSPQYNFAFGAGYNTNPGASPSQMVVNTPLIFEPPFAVISAAGNVNTGSAQIWIGCASASTMWGGANVWISHDGTNYTQIGVINAPARQGVVTALVNPFTGVNPDTLNAVAVDLTQSNGALTSGSSIAASLGNTLSLVDSEFFSYQTATLSSQFQYSLTNLYRGLYGSTAAGHSTSPSSAATFTRLDNAIGKFNLPAPYINQPVSVKLQSFNIYGSGVQTLASCTVYTYVPFGYAMMHPLGQALNYGNQDAGSITSTAAVTDDYGYVLATVPGGTLYYMPVTVDAGSFVSAFSMQFISSKPNQFKFANNKGSANNGKLTVAFWVNITTGSVNQIFWNAAVATVNYLAIGMNGSNEPVVYFNSTTTTVLTYNAIVGTGSFHHFCVEIDLTQATSSDRCHVEIDGSRRLLLTGSYPSSATTSTSLGFANQSASFIGLGGPGVNSTSSLVINGTVWFNGIMSEYYMIDGQQLTASNFINGTPGTPIAYQGSYSGKVDAHLSFITSTNLGQDFSGENNAYVSASVPSNITSTNQVTSYP